MKITKEELMAEAIKLAKKFDEYNKECSKEIMTGGKYRTFNSIRIQEYLELKTCTPYTEVDFFVSNDDPVKPGEKLEHTEVFDYAKRVEDGIIIMRTLKRPEEEE